jgi:hypothetical protein
LASDLEEEYQWEDEEPMDDIVDYKEVEYVDFLSVEDILNSPTNDVA